MTYPVYVQTLLIPPYTPPIELPSGLSVTLSRDDRAPYFSRNNLRTSGLLSDFNRTQFLPDNFYRFCSGKERAAFTVDYVLDPNIPAKPPVADNGVDPIRDANGNYIFTKGENGKYQFVFTDSEGHEHTLENDDIPFTVTDGNGTL